MQTPYSADAKWNTGEQSRISNFESRKISNTENEKEENLTREEVLRGIEQPSERVGPTGWRPPARSGNDGTLPLENPPPPQYHASGYGAQRGLGTSFNKGGMGELRPTTPPPIPPLAPTTPPRGLPRRDSGQVGTPPRAGGEDEPEDLIEQKLAGPTGAAHTEKRYTIDPYREPLG